MKANPKFTDSPEFDDFFRRGDESTQGADSLQPVAASGSDEELGREFVRTPAQVERRAKFVKYVSISMVCLTAGLASGLTYRALQRSTRGHFANVDSSSASRIDAAQPETHPRAISQAIPEGIAAVPPEPIEAKSPAVEHVDPERQERNPATVPGDAVPIADAAEVPAAVPRAVTVGLPQPLPPSATVSKPSAVNGKSRTSDEEGEVVTELRPVPKAVPVVPGDTMAPVAVKRPSRVVPSGVKIKPTKVVQAKSVGPKPEGYRPPTASFSD